MLLGSLAGSVQGERLERPVGFPTTRGSEPITFPAKRESGRRARGGVARSPARRESSGVNQNKAVGIFRGAEIPALRDLPFLNRSQ
jgi:hypothetical protein